MAGAQGLVDGADAGRLVDGGLFLYREVQRKVEEGVFPAAFRFPFRVQIVLDVFQIIGIFLMGFENPQCFLLQCVQLQRGKPLPPNVGEEAAHIVGVYVIHGLLFRKKRPSENGFDPAKRFSDGVYRYSAFQRNPPLPFPLPLRC